MTNAGRILAVRWNFATTDVTGLREDGRMLGLLISIRFVFPLRPSSEVSKEWQIDSAVRAAEQKNE